jgi:Asp-tRNA(Asn)/Glu-tRNA(Gln) amidotransferase A subunit family amidase
MSLSDELALLNATAQADLVHRRQVNPIESVDAAIARIERLNPALNAVITPLFGCFPKENLLRKGVGEALHQPRPAC